MKINQEDASALQSHDTAYVDLYRTMDSGLHIRTIALIGYLVHALKKNADLSLSSHIQEELFDYAQELRSSEVGRHFLNEAVRAVDPSYPIPASDKPERSGALENLLETLRAEFRKTNGDATQAPRTFEAVLRIRDTALTGCFLGALQDKGIGVTREVEEVLYQAAEAFGAMPEAQVFTRTECGYKKPQAPHP
ncbi:MAG TPA: hypothetical protein PKX87_07835 [Alphaproteobacteria bacterium]|nr:hypothetical protein [Alphaproteobacteria bacterium]